MVITEIAEALIKRRFFLLTQCRLDRQDGGDFDVTIVNNFPLAVHPAERKTLEHPGNELYRWAAGGGIVILDCEDLSFGLVRYRDAGAPSFGDHWTVGSGLSGTFDELCHPEQLIVREAVEEFIIATEHGIVVPVFDDDSINAIAFGAVGSGRHIRTRSGCQGLLKTDRYIECSASFAKLPGESMLSVGFEGVENRSQTRGLVCVDEGTRSIDLLRVIRIGIPFRSDEITVYDGEEDRQGMPLNARVGCLLVQDNKIFPAFAMCFQNGERIGVQSYNGRATPPLKSLMEALK